MSPSTSSRINPSYLHYLFCRMHIDISSTIVSQILMDHIPLWEIEYTGRVSSCDDKIQINISKMIIYNRYFTQSMKPSRKLVLRLRNIFIRSVQMEWKCIMLNSTAPTWQKPFIFNNEKKKKKWDILLFLLMYSF